ncbi:MAG: hypothetical protein CVV00_09170 [Firmicutes bacterium HGW-Firmicutes-5]|nr:MAG: hypothetical protein CVV00_09170 [Firmicutes bacterium HGW-Firmicutes-5]
MRLFEKILEIISRKKDQDDLSSDMNEDVSGVQHNHQNHQSFQYVTKNAKLLNLSYEEKSERIDNLSARERETYLLLLEGFTLKECAKQMGIKYSTVNTYTTAVYKKLKVNTRAELIINYHEKMNIES